MAHQRVNSKLYLHTSVRHPGGYVANTEIKMTIVNWDKFNPKRDQKTYTWLRLDNTVATDPKLFGLDAEQKFVWIVILCQASQKNSGDVSLSLGWIGHATGVATEKIEQTLSYLESQGILELHDRARSRVVVATTPTYERTNVRILSETAFPPLASIWNQEATKRLAKVKSVRGKRLSACNARWKENPDPEFWKDIINRINTSDFLSGKTSDWAATFDWLIKPGNCDKVLEGNYKQHGRQNTNGQVFRVVED